MGAVGARLPGGIVTVSLAGFTPAPPGRRAGEGAGSALPDPKVIFLSDPFGPPSPYTTYMRPPSRAAWRSTPPYQLVANETGVQPVSRQLSFASTRIRFSQPLA